MPGCCAGWIESPLNFRRLTRCATNCRSDEHRKRNDYASNDQEAQEGRAAGECYFLAVATGRR